MPGDGHWHRNGTPAPARGQWAPATAVLLGQGAQHRAFPQIAQDATAAHAPGVLEGQQLAAILALEQLHDADLPLGGKGRKGASLLTNVKPASPWFRDRTGPPAAQNCPATSDGCKLPFGEHNDLGR